jgi:hypothetical protein
MKRRLLYSIAVAAALTALPSLSRAQEAPQPDTLKPDASKADTAAEPRSPAATLRVQVVISRYQGEKKLASLPYTLVVTTGGGRARMRMGVDTPVPLTIFPSSDADKPSVKTSFQYKTVGTNIDCAAWEHRGGRYKLSVGVENSSALTGSAGVEGAPLFRRFDTNLDAMLRDGQSLQTIASTDPVTGEVVKIDVTMNVVR